MKRKKPKKNFLLILILIIFLFCAAFFFIIDSDIFSIHTIRVENNNIFTQEEIIQMSKVVFGTNTFKLKTKDISERIENNAQIKWAQIKRDLPDALIITIKEREDVACIYFLDYWIIIDEEGFVLKTEEVNPKLTVLEGLVIDDFTIGEKLKSKNEAFLNDVLNVIIETEKYDLFFKKIEIVDNQLKIYITDRLTCTANTQILIKNMDILRGILYDLHKQGIRRGVVSIQENGYYTFSPIE